MRYVLKDHLEKLPGFLGVAERGSLRKAASELGISQPALTRQIAVLESVLGQPLFQRSTGGVSLTPAGTLLRDFSKQLLSNSEAVERKLRKNRQAQPQVTLCLRVGALESLAIRIWPRLVGLLRDKFPDLNIAVTTGTADELDSLVARGKLDCALSIVRARKLASLSQVVLLNDAYGFFCSPAFAKSHARAIANWDSVRELPIAMVQDARDDSGKTLKAILGKRSLRCRNPLAVDTFEAAMNYATEGVAAAVVPYLLAEPLVKRKVLLPMLHPEANRFGDHRLGLVVRTDHHQAAPWRAIEETLRAALGRLEDTPRLMP